MSHTVSTISPGLARSAQVSDAYPSRREYLTTNEAMQYLRRSKSWLLRRGDIPFMPGKPNIYARRDLDAWYDRNKHNPMV
jgi:hypothetical protein